MVFDIVQRDDDCHDDEKGDVDGGRDGDGDVARVGCIGWHNTLGHVTFHQTLIAHPHLHQADLHHPHHLHADHDQMDEDDDQDPAPLSEKLGYGNFYEQHRSLFIRIKSLFIGISIQTKTPFKIN